VGLRDSYLASHICSALKIHDVALKRWAAECSPTPPLPSTTTPAALVELPAEPAPPEPIEHPGNTTHAISIDLGDAIQLRVHAQFTLEEILAFARQHQQRISA